MKRTSATGKEVIRKYFKKENNNREYDNVTGSSMKRTSATGKEVIRKYFKKVKPLYEKLSQKQQQKMGGHVHSIPPTSTANNAVSLSLKSDRSMKDIDDVSSKDGRKGSSTGVFSHSFSGNLRLRRRSCASSCPSPMRSSPSHSCVLCKMLWVQLVQQLGLLQVVACTMETHYRWRNCRALFKVQLLIARTPRCKTRP
ncbi:hypothetical protein H0E87_015579 [Populus deltoides]|uniref:Uncharacterized protein n=1 Tax=Populus deltoides TaxID=3696 RepID=A0A8T2Y5G6_POPDE|nr:hypothetical protein H0E87_015579 [Populus deltoides]